MTATLVYERINNHICAFPLEELKSTYGKSYYKFYQLKLQQLLTENRYRQEHDSKYTKIKRSQTPLNDTRSSQEYMNHLREKFKTSLQNDEYGKRSHSVVGITNRNTKHTITYTITSTEISTTSTIVSKPILKTKRSSISTKRQRVTSAPANGQRNLQKKTPIKIPIIQIDSIDESLSKSDSCSYTQVSSSSQDHIEKKNENARQFISNTIMLHLHSSTPSNLSKWNLYRDFDDKFSASISPTVYRNYERIIL